MCFHTNVSQLTSKLEKSFSVALFEESIRPLFDTPQYHLNGFAHPNMLVIPQERNTVLAPGVWGIVPKQKKASEIKTYFKEATAFGGGLNARSEKIFQHFLYKESVLNKRCIIPISGFFEPHEYNKKKYPFYIHNKNEEPLALAGLYTVIDTYITFTILTKEASPQLAEIHNVKKRQPVILAEDNYQSWLTNELNELQIKELINSDCPESMLECYPVSKDVFSPKIDSNNPSIIDKVSYSELK
ncbi:SOS response-associated peptidase [Formosa maritima]|uniref:Abasic site processing protein n=1 Tax=Formosa maritima TaxID=2592046 RepID=A0A5D0GDA6_9FLAO|nr:SOS response-associated peptidase [Formosa maritima]TYA56690.1 SOS response-associated peptidase [Formosa maritima]